MKMAQESYADDSTLPYSDEELENLKQIFALFDHDRSGRIDIVDVQEIMKQLNRDPEEASSLLREAEVQDEGQLTFEEFVRLLSQVEQTLAADDRDEGERSANELGDNPVLGTPEEAAPDGKVVDFLRLLVDYRKKCEEKGDYSEAKKAKQKFEELRRKEIERQMELIKQSQLKEAENIEKAQKDQFAEFSQAWDNYMADYEATAYMSLEKLKEKHLHEFQSFYDKAVKDARIRVKHSKELLELRKRQVTLVRMNKYEEAEEVRAKADQLEEWEDTKNDSEVKDIVERKVSQMRRQHQMALAALLKRIQRDRNEQIKHRQLDSQRLIQRSINLRSGIQSKHLNEAKKTILELKRQLGTMLQDATSRSRGRSSAP